MVLILFSSVARGSSPKKKTERLIAVYQKQLPCQQIFLSGMAFTPHSPLLTIYEVVCRRCQTTLQMLKFMP